MVLIADAFPDQYGTVIFHVTPDLRIFSFVFLISIFAGVLFGLAPALESSRWAVSSALKGNAATSPIRSRHLRNFLIATQVAVSAVLVIAGSTLILHPETLAGAVLFRPMVPFVPETMPQLSRKPILILAGTRDSIVPRDETERLAGLLERAGADLTLRWADATHGISGDEVRVAAEWLASKFPD